MVSRIDPKLPSFVVGDPTRFRQVLTNLVGNAIKFTENGEVVVSLIMESEDDWGSSVVLSVADTGVGIPNENLDKIFNPFFTTKPIGSGTGLGLSLAYKIITEKHRGTLSVRSTMNEGSVFTIILPRELQP